MKGLVYLNIHVVSGEKIAAICDEELFGKKLVDSTLGIEFNVSGPFYGGELVPVEYAMAKAREADIINLVGKRSVEAAMREGFVHPEAVLEIAGVPHAQVVKVLY